MGTSNSGKGPGDKTPLLPTWALPNGPDLDDAGDTDVDDVDDAGDEHGDAGEGHDSRDSGDDGEVNKVDADGDRDVAAGDTHDDGATPEQPAPTAISGAFWAAAKRSLGSIAKSGGGGRGRMGSAGRAYVRARGGARAAASSATSARGATSRLGGFLSDVSNRGVGPALESLGLGQFVGRDAHEVFAAIIDALAPEGADLEQSATRDAIEQTLAGLFEQYVGLDGSVTALEAMTPDAIRAAVEASVVASIFNRWLGDLERSLEEKAVTAAQAVKLERDMQLYIRDTVKLDLTDKDPLTMHWHGAEGSTFVERIYQEAYSILGGSR
jgi:hypothetical protein